MPELPEVERLRRTLEAAMVGARFKSVLLNRRDLRQPFPAGFKRKLQGHTVRAITRRGKYLLVELSTGDVLLMHLGMSGWFRVERTSAVAARGADPDLALENRHDHVVFTMSSGLTVTFNDPRRFGMMDLVAANRLPLHASIGTIGPEPLSRSFDAEALARGCNHRRSAIKVALLDQHVVAGIGNIYASEALHLARLSPFRPASTLVTKDGTPRPECTRLVTAIKTVLRRAISLKEAERYRETRFRVYDREGERCISPGCNGRILRVVQAGRSTFYCPVCQK